MNKSEGSRTAPDRSPSPKRLDQVRTACRRRGLSYATEQAYLRWIKRYILFHGTRYPTSLGAEHVKVRSALTDSSWNVHPKGRAVGQAHDLMEILYEYTRTSQLHTGQICYTVTRIRRPGPAAERTPP